MVESVNSGSEPCVFIQVDWEAIRAAGVPTREKLYPGQYLLPADEQGLAAAGEVDEDPQYGQLGLGEWRIDLSSLDSDLLRRFGEWAAQYIIDKATIGRAVPRILDGVKCLEPDERDFLISPIIQQNPHLNFNKDKSPLE